MSTTRRIILSIALAIPVWLGINLILSGVTCLAFGPWGAGLEGTSASDVPWYLPWLHRLLFVLVITASVLISWRLVPKLTKGS